MGDDATETEFKLTLIDLVKRYDCLWNQESSRYKDNDEALVCWKIIADCLNEQFGVAKTKEQIRDHWQSLRTSYVKKRRAYVPTDSYDRPPKWKYYSAMQFLEAHVHHRKGKLDRRRKRVPVVKSDERDAWSSEDDQEDESDGDSVQTQRNVPVASKDHNYLDCQPAIEVVYEQGSKRKHDDDAIRDDKKLAICGDDSKPGKKPMTKNRAIAQQIELTLDELSGEEAVQARRELQDFIRKYDR